MLQALLDCLAPQACLACDGPSSEPFCADCRPLVSLEPPVPALIGGVPVLAAAPYAPPVTVALQRFKYHERPDLAEPLAALLWPRLAGLPRGDELTLVPVPLHPRRLAERGYNQAALLAAALARRIGARHAPRALARARDTEQLAGQSRAERAARVAGAFVVRQRHELDSRSILLIDDVVTTGATAGACIELLQRAGAQVAAVVAVACVEPA